MNTAAATEMDAPPGSQRRHERSTTRLRVGFVLHVMQVAGAEMLVAETIRRLSGRIDADDLLPRRRRCPWQAVAGGGS